MTGVCVACTYVVARPMNHVASAIISKHCDVSSGAITCSGLLEWKTNRKVALMALGAEFSDGMSITGHVTSYTSSGED